MVLYLPCSFTPSLTPELCFTGIYYHLLLEQAFLVTLLAMSGCLAWFSCFVWCKTECFFGIIWRKFLTGQMLMLSSDLLCLLLSTVFQLNLGEPFPHVAFLLLFQKRTFGISGIFILFHVIRQWRRQQMKLGWARDRCMVSVEVWIYSEGLGLVPQRGPRAQSLVTGSPLKLKIF